jgi:hypothetical protein
VLRTAAQRWNAEELDRRIADGPRFHYAPPTAALLDELVRRYGEITGDPVRQERPGKRNLVAACYRVHGDDVLPYIADEFRGAGTAINLLGRLRCSPPRHGAGAWGADGARPSPVPADDRGPNRVADSAEGIVWARGDVLVKEKRHDAVDTGPGDCGCDEADLLPGLIYCAAHCPPFDPTSRRRYDRRPSNPDAARFFAAMNGPAFTGALTQ